MSPWMWLLWAVVALVILFVASAAFAAVTDGFRKQKPCARCGHDPNDPACDCPGCMESARVAVEADRALRNEGVEEA